nr:uncharacterized protein LOC127315225 [Lolium perenne]
MAKTEATHGKESNHGKVQGNLTAKKGRRQSPYVPHGKETMHGSIAVARPFANPPQYVGEDDRCFLAMVMWWTCPQYLKKHEEGKKKRAEMRGGSHIQGSLPISLHLQKEEVRTGAKPNVFAVLKKMKQRKTPHPETGSVWVNPQSETQCTSYVSKFKQKYGEEANPEAEDFDPEVAVLAGEGLKLVTMDHLANVYEL